MMKMKFAVQQLTIPKQFNGYSVLAVCDEFHLSRSSFNSGFLHDLFFFTILISYHRNSFFFCFIQIILIFLFLLSVVRDSYREQRLWFSELNKNNVHLVCCKLCDNNKVTMILAFHFMHNITVVVVYAIVNFEILHLLQKRI